MNDTVLSSDIFDPKPLNKKIEKKKAEEQTLKRLQDQIPECVSISMSTTPKKEKPDQSGHQIPKNQQKATPKSNINNCKLLSDGQKVLQNQKISVFDFFDKNSPMTSKLFKVIKQIQKQFEETESPYELDLSDQNFLIELFTKTGLIKYYKSFDRTFSKLFQYAKNTYYTVRRRVAQQKQNSDVNRPDEKKDGKQMLKQNKVENLPEKLTSAFIQTNKRLQQAMKDHFKLPMNLQSEGNVIGYDLQSQNSSNKSVESQQKSAFQQDSTSLSGFQFVESSSVNKKQKKPCQPSVPKVRSHDELYYFINEKFGSFKKKSNILEGDQ